MSLSMYQQSVPVLVRALGNLRAFLAKGAAHCEAKKLDPFALTSFRLYPDMFPMSRQVQIACDISKGCVARLSGATAPVFEDTERTFAELDARIEKTLAFVRSIPADQIDGTENKAVVIKTPFRDLNFEGQDYVQKFVLPNVYFHSATAYNILRHNGVDVGKMDFLGQD